MTAILCCNVNNGIKPGNPIISVKERYSQLPGFTCHIHSHLCYVLTQSAHTYIHTWSLVTTALQETGGSCVMLYTKFMFYFLLFQFSVTVWLGLSNKLLVKVICKCDTTRYFQVDIFKGNFVVFVTTKTSFFWCVGNLGHLKPCLWCLNWVFWWDSLGNIQPCLRRPKPKIFHRKLGRLQPCLWQLKQVLWMRPLWWTKQEFQAKPWCSPNPKQVLCLNLTGAYKHSVVTREKWKNWTKTRRFNSSVEKHLAHIFFSGNWVHFSLAVTFLLFLLLPDASASTETKQTKWRWRFCESIFCSITRLFWTLR